MVQTLIGWIRNLEVPYWLWEILFSLLGKINLRKLMIERESLYACEPKICWHKTSFKRLNTWMNFNLNCSAFWINMHMMTNVHFSMFNHQKTFLHLSMFNLWFVIFECKDLNVMGDPNWISKQMYQCWLFQDYLKLKVIPISPWLYKDKIFRLWA